MPPKKTSNGFNLNGPLPLNPTVPGMLSKFQKPTAVSTALNTVAQPEWKNQLNTVMSGYKPPTTSQSMATSGGQTMLPKTSGIIKKEITTNADGSKKEIHYDNTLQNGQDTGATPTPTSNPDNQEKTTPNPLPTNGTPEKTPQDTTYKGLIGEVAKTSADTSAIDKANEELQKLRSGYAEKTGAIETTPIPLEFQQGRKQVLGRQFATQESAAQQALANTLTARGQTISGLGTAAGLMAPRQQGYVMIDPTTGQPIVGAGGVESAITRGARYGALETGVGQSALDNQAIRGAESGIASITDLIQRGNLNPSNVNLANETIQAIQKNLSSQDYMTLLNSLEAINAALTKVTGTPVDIAALSSSQGTSLIATINNQVQIAKAIAEAKAVPQTGGQTTPSTDIFSW